MSSADGDVSESLSDIDDAEVVGYLNSKQAALFKRMIWEAMNKDYNKGYAPAFEEGTNSNCGSHGDMQLSNEKKTVLKAVMMMSLSMKVMDTVKRLKRDKVMMMIHMLQMTNIMDATMMTNTITMRNAILTNYDSNSLFIFHDSVVSCYDQKVKQLNLLDFDNFFELVSV
ncbi:uncharacterized protein Pyn_40939 [Prunus yedoensis var. nudiflora]|uniref:Uncharacterized protein n=1 Tax=Prunus yedoensis var. nudiflora TaxID=2094558 RepID=A0A314URZ8_PRUYE|nr:uncharacterized protein Pyn_40939 [Prunus yedoensis var. nudiflora]